MSLAGPSGRRVAKNTVAQLASLIMAGASKAVAAVMVARYLGPDGLGVFSLSWTLAGTLSFLAVAGLDYRLIRELARSEDKREFEVSFTLGTALAAAIGLALWLFPTVSGIHDHVMSALSGAAAYIALSGPVLMLRAAFHARERMELESAGTIVEGVMSIAGVAVALSFHADVPGAMLGLAAGRLGNLLVSLWLFRRECGPFRLRFEGTKWGSLLRISTPMAVTYAFTAVYMRFDVVLLAAMRPAVEVGLYGAASVVILTVPIIASAFNGSLYPVLSRAGSVHDPRLAKVFSQTVRLLLLTSIPLAVGLAIVARDVIGVVYGSVFDPAVPALAVLAVILPLRFLNNLFGHVLTAVDRQGKRTRGVVVAAAVNLLLNAAAIPAFGFMGAVYATLATEVLLICMFLPALRPLRVGAQGAVEGILISVVMGGVVSVVPGGMFVRLGAGAAVFAAALIVLFRASLPGLRGPKASPTIEPTDIAGRPGRVVVPVRPTRGGTVSQRVSGDRATLRFSVVGGVNVRLDGTACPAGSWVERIFSGMPDPTSDEDHLTFVFEDGVRPVGRRLPPLNVGHHPGGLWIADHLNRAAVVPFHDLSAPIRVDGAIDARTFTNNVFHPVLRAALWSRRSVFMRGAGAEIFGKNVGIAAWAETGKSRTLFELLSRGHGYLGDDWFGLTPAGVAGPISTQLDVRDGQRSFVPPERWPGRRSRVRPRLVSAARSLARATSGSPNVSAGFDKIAQAAWKAGWIKSDLGTVFPDAPVARPGALEVMVVLCDPGAPRPSTADIPERLAASIAGEVGYTELEAVYRFTNPGSVPGPLFPRFEALKEQIAVALADATVAVIPFGGSDEDVRAVADVIEGLVSSHVVPAAEPVPASQEVVA